jgi:hypothetical protein
VKKSGVKTGEQLWQCALAAVQVQKPVSRFCGSIYILHSIFQNKKSFENFLIFLYTVYRVRSAVIGGNFTPIEEYSSTVKNQQK